MASLERHWPSFLALVREAHSSPALFAFIAAPVDEAIGSKLTTATVFDVPAGRQAASPRRAR